MFHLVTIAIAASAATTSGNADSLGRKLQQIADSVVAANPKIPGVLIFVKSRELGGQWSIAAGRSDTVAKTPLDPRQPVRVASVTKTFTATAILRLVEQGKLSLSDPLSKHLPAALDSLLRRDGYPTDRITIEQVLSHRAGLNEHPAVPSYVAAIAKDPSHRWTPVEQVRWLVDSLDPVGAPGAQFKYSDTGYVLLGAIIAKYTGRNYGEGVRQLIGFDKLGLRHTWFESLEEIPAGTPPRPHQYMSGVDTYNLDPSFDLYGGGGVVAPLDELGGFFEKLLQGRILVKRATLDTMIAARSPDFGGYGLGIFGVKQRGRQGYGHSGFWGVMAWHFPVEGVTVSVAVTEQSQGGQIFPIGGAVMRVLYPDQ